MALTGRVLGALFYFEPTSDNVTPVIEMLKTADWETEWPIPSSDLPHISTLLAQQNQPNETLSQAYQRLFIGPWALPSPPWGSVWLDRESVLFGDSTLALREWMQQHGISHHGNLNEPEDHFGLLLMLAAWLAEEQQFNRVDELLAWHLFPWSERFLACFIKGAEHPFWQGVGELARLTLAEWRKELLIPVPDKPLYRE
ncbi:Tat proofreading chaperone DmsD [Apirhabdus apintestini]|nr:Tat proofreading chaperone DmsD [Enterobacteriaceae bacterium CA-0114]